MASNINPFNIDGTYPVAGQDNDSQGFRDNFTNVRNNLSYAKSEIEDLQSKAVLKSALTGSTVNNNMAGATLQGPKLMAVSYSLMNAGIVSGGVTLDYSFGNMQKLTTAGDIALSFTNWPASDIYGCLKLWVVVTDPVHTLTVPITVPGVTLGLTDIAGANAQTGTLTFDQVGNYVLEFTTTDNGQNILITDLTRNSSTLRDPNLYYNDSITPTLLIGFGDSLDSAGTMETGRDAVSSLGSYNSVTVGNLALANVSYAQVESGSLAGYSITSARGNLQTNTIGPVSTRDYLGYVNAVAFTGNGSGNVFQQVSSLSFFATGSNVAYGLGSNIALFTAKDGNRAAGSDRSTTQAVGIENDQSVRFYGNVVLNSGAPATSTSIGVAGQVAYDGTYFYVCTSTNTWKRVQLNLTSW